MLTLVLVVIVISLLILAHEWGHFYSARKLGIKIEEFGFGFPPCIFSKTKNGIRYSFNLLPFGGFVKIFGEHGEGEGQKDSFISRPAWQRFIILSAGVAMNMVLAWVFFSMAAGLGLPKVSDNPEKGTPVSIIDIAPGSPAEKAGLRLGDKILEARSREITLRIESKKDLQNFVEAYRGEEITLVVERGKEIKEVKAVPRVFPPEGEGPLGIGLARLSRERVPFYLAPLRGAETLWTNVGLTITGLFSIVKTLISRGATMVTVTGPVGIFTFARDTQLLGSAFFLQFVGILSVNLAILNFLPIPALDGGRIFFLAIEKMRKKRINPELENFIHTLGFVFLLLLMILVTYRDVMRIL